MGVLHAISYLKMRRGFYYCHFCAPVVVVTVVVLMMRLGQSGDV